MRKLFTLLLLLLLSVPAYPMQLVGYGGGGGGDTCPVYRDPTGDATTNGTISGTPGSRYMAVDDYPDTAGNDYLEFGTASFSRITFSYSPINLPIGTTISSVQVFYYDAEPAGGVNAVQGRVKVGGLEYSDATHDPSGTTYTLRTYTQNLNPKTGLSWTLDEINGDDPTNSLEAFGVSGSDSNPVWRASSVQLKVSCTLP